ncbi:hypothetical protein [Frankia sp. Cj5]|uniref:hypothetical protein n=1 Tax=Frankia sp. Cj5 TaxID=2880978 RepID=UPI001EF61BCF|nr:hypothetical protein [Frankia sp. Cj5]
MSHRPGVRTATISLFATASLIGAVALTSCAAGNDAVTAQARTTTNTVSGAIGTISLRNVYVAGPAASGEKAQVVSAFFNGGAEEDQIVQVASPAATGGQAPKRAILEPGGSNIYIADGNAPTLTGLNRDLLVGQAIAVTFTFAKAGSITLAVPVEPPAPGASAPPATSLPTPSARSVTSSPTASVPASATSSPTAGTTHPAGATG